MIRGSLEVSLVTVTIDRFLISTSESSTEEIGSNILNRVAIIIFTIGSVVIVMDRTSESLYDM